LTDAVRSEPDIPKRLNAVMVSFARLHLATDTNKGRRSMVEIYAL